MGLIDYIKNMFTAYTPEKDRRVQWLMNSTPIFSEFGSDLYLSDFVNNAIDRIASEVSKIEVWSVVEKHNPEQVEKINDDISRLFRFQPNQLQTTKDFIGSIEWLRRKNSNAFIYPVYDWMNYGGTWYKKYRGFYPLNPVSIQIGTSGAGTIWELEFTFSDGSHFVIPYSEVIHMRWRRGTNMTLGGGSDLGGSDTRDLLRSVTALDKVIQGLPKTIEASLQIRGVYKAKTTADWDKLNKERDAFESHMLKSSAGIVATTLQGDIEPINFTPANVPNETLRFLKTVISERYGVAPEILLGKFTGEDHAAFYQTAIEEFIVEFEQAFSSRLFTQREQDIGHRVKAYYNRVAYMSNKDKLDLAALGKETGLMTLNQMAEMFGMPPFAGGDRRLQSLNFVNLELIDDYQQSKSGVDLSPIDDKGDDENG